LTVVLYRVDERLIHGQVVIGWGSELRPDHYVVVDDDLSRSEWEQELYRLSLPEGVEGEFLDVESARARLPDLESDEHRTVVLVRDVGTMLRVARDRALEGRSVNLGGIHHAEGRVRIRSYLYLDPSDQERIRALAGEGVTVSGRDLPDSAKIGLDDLLPSD
jgi:PTS system mannose-specific IIB component/fructoselysine and glucoselysine-specific PTS system IIB component